MLHQPASTLLTHLRIDRSWNHVTGEQLDCFTCAPAEPSDGVTALDVAAPVSSLNGTSADGGVPPASALQQGDAAKHDLGDADDTGLGTHLLLLAAAHGDRPCYVCIPCLLIIS